MKLNFRGRIVEMGNLDKSGKSGFRVETSRGTFEVATSHEILRQLPLYGEVEVTFDIKEPRF